MADGVVGVCVGVGGGLPVVAAVSFGLDGGWLVEEEEASRALTRVNLTLFMFERMRSTTSACLDQRTSWSCMPIMKSPSRIPALFIMIIFKEILVRNLIFNRLIGF